MPEDTDRLDLPEGLAALAEDFHAITAGEEDFQERPFREEFLGQFEPGQSLGHRDIGKEQVDFCSMPTPEIEGLRARFVHEARFDRRERRVEMHLRSLAEQRITIRDVGLSFEMPAGETIWTESSYKYTAEEIRLMACRAGLDCAEQLVDEEWPFAESLLEVRDNSRP